MIDLRGGGLAGPRLGQSKRKHVPGRGLAGRGDGFWFPRAEEVRAARAGCWEQELCGNG